LSYEASEQSHRGQRSTSDASITYQVTSSDDEVLAGSAGHAALVFEREFGKDTISVFQAGERISDILRFDDAVLSSVPLRVINGLWVAIE